MLTKGSGDGVEDQAGKTHREASVGNAAAARCPAGCARRWRWLVFAVFGFYYVKYQGIVDERLKQPLFANTAKIYAAPREVRPGQKLSVQLIANELREAGYTTDGAAQASPLGTYSEGAQSITVHPGPQSYHAEDPATIHSQRRRGGLDHRRTRPARWPATNWSRCSSPA